MKSTITLLLSLFVFVVGHGQVIEYPVETMPALHHAPSIDKSQKGFRSAALGLPIADDFSNPGPRPLASIWEDDFALVNGVLGVKPPTQGVVTFDGLDNFGFPYGGGRGPSDVLTTQEIDLTPYTPGSSVYLSFFYQARGCGDKPETADSLICEFLDDTGTWRQVWAKEGIPDSTATEIPPFKFVRIGVGLWDYYHSGFKFRFRNISARTGFVDLWNIDYVRLTDGMVPDEILGDVAFSNQPGNALVNYSAAPIRHLDNEPLWGGGFFNNPPSLDVQNHTGGNFALDSAVIRIQERLNGTTNFFEKVCLQTPSAPNLTLPMGHDTINKLFINNAQVADFANGFGLAFPLTEALLDIEVIMYANGQSSILPTAMRNDTVRRTYQLSNFYAYDDGSAESNVGAQNQGTEIAVKYATFNFTDSLRGIRMHIPHVAGDVTSQFMNLKVWLGTLDDTPEYFENFITPIYIDSVNGFTTFAFRAPVEIPANSVFYVGWQQGSANASPIPIGLDKNNLSATQNNFFNTGVSGWQPFPNTLRGAIMLRPVFGAGPLITTNVSNTVRTHNVVVYPNPTNDLLHIDGIDLAEQLEIISMDGRVIRQFDFQKEIEVGDLPSGIYYLRIHDYQANIVPVRFIKQ